MPRVKEVKWLLAHKTRISFTALKFQQNKLPYVSEVSETYAWDAEGPRAYSLTLRELLAIPAGTIFRKEKELTPETVSE
jgi:hypothetical protein